MTPDADENELVTDARNRNACIRDLRRPGSNDCHHEICSKCLMSPLIGLGSATVQFLSRRWTGIVSPARTITGTGAHSSVSSFVAYGSQPPIPGRSTGFTGDRSTARWFRLGRLALITILNVCTSPAIANTASGPAN
jgi:hypothetical protein